MIDEILTDDERIRNQSITIRRQAQIIQALQADRLVHALLGAVIGGGLVLLAKWQADPLIRWIDAALTASGWTAP